MIKKSLAIAGLALAAVVPVASATPNGGPSEPVGSEQAVISLVCGPHYQYYADGFATQYVMWTAAGDDAKAQDALVHLWWTIYVHLNFC